MTDTPDPDVCPGPCNRAWEAAERHTHDTGEPHHLTPTPGQPIWCPDCRARIERDLRDLPDLAAGLPPGALNTPPADLGRLSRADIHASPSPAIDLLDEVIRWAVTTEDNLRAHLGHPSRRHERHRMLWPSVSYLTGHLSPLLSLDPDGIDFGLSVMRWHRRLTLASGDAQRELVYRVPGQCPNTRCNRRGQLRRLNGDDLVKCRACGTCWDYEHWQLLVRAVVEAG